MVKGDSTKAAVTMKTVLSVNLRSLTMTESQERRKNMVVDLLDNFRKECELDVKLLDLSINKGSECWKCILDLTQSLQQTHASIFNFDKTFREKFDDVFKVKAKYYENLAGQLKGEERSRGILYAAERGKLEFIKALVQGSEGWFDRTDEVMWFSYALD